MRRSQPPKAKREKKCKACLKSFHPFLSTQVVCGVKCALIWGRKEAEKRARQKHRCDIERIKPRSKLLAEAQVAFNAFIRLRDADLGCVSCDKTATWSGQWHASHYRSVGAHTEFRFDESNVHKACSVCNNVLSGALSEYRQNLIKRIGEAGVLRLEGPAEIPKRTREQIIEIKESYRKKCRELRKLHRAGL